MGKELYNIKEFAEAVGVTPQYIYQKIKDNNSPLQSYVKKVNNKKFIKSQALNLFIDSNNNNNSNENTVDIIEILKDELKTVREESEQKDKRITELLTLVSDTNKLLDQQQKLNLIDKQKLLELETSIKESEKAEKQEPAEEQKKKKHFFKWFKK